MKTKDELRQMDVNHLFHPIVVPKLHEQKGPRIIVEGDGLRIKDIDGKEYIDTFSGLWNVVTGYGQQAVNEAISEQLSHIHYFSPFYGFATPPAIELADKVVSMMPREWNMGRVLFTCGGSETNDTNIKIARMYWALKGRNEKKTIVSRRSAYHGLTLGAMSATGIDVFKAYFDPLSPGFLHIMAPHCYRCELNLTYPGCGVACAKQLEETIQKEGADTIAAFIGEPVIGAGGTIPPPAEYWPMIREICDRHEVLLIADEVVTGFGRTGKMFGCMNWDLRPDMVSIAKGLTSGYFPLGGAVMNNDIYGTIREGLGEEAPFFHGFTYNNHPVGCAAGLANLKIIEESNLVENAAKMGAYLAEGLEKMHGHSCVGDIRTFGLMAAVEIVKDKETKEQRTPPLLGARRVEELMWEKGIYARSMFECIGIAPPLIISKEDIDLILDELDASIGQMEQEKL